MIPKRPIAAARNSSAWLESSRPLESSMPAPILKSDRTKVCVVSFMGLLDVDEQSVPEDQSFLAAAGIGVREHDVSSSRWSKPAVEGALVEILELRVGGTHAHEIGPGVIEPLRDVGRVVE